MSKARSYIVCAYSDVAAEFVESEVFDTKLLLALRALWEAMTAEERDANAHWIARVQKRRSARA